MCNNDVTTTQLTTTDVLDVSVDETELSKPLINEHAEVVSVHPFTEAEIEAMTKQIELSFKMLRVMKDCCLNNIQSSDVMDMNGEPYIYESGFSNFKIAFAIEEKELVKTIVYKDGSSRISTDPLSMQGDFDYVLMTGIIRSNKFGVETRVSGGVKVDEDFSDDKSFWLKKAEANWKRRAISNLLGLQKVMWKNLINVNKEECGSVVHSKTKKADSEKATKTWDDLLALNNGNVKAAEDMCVQLTAYRYQDKDVKGVTRPSKLTEKALEYLVQKIDKLLKQNGHRAVNAPAPAPVQQLGNGNGNNSPVASLLKQLGDYYLQDQEIFNEVIARNGYTNQTLKTETEEFRLEVMIEQIKSKLKTKATQTTSTKI